MVHQNEDFIGNPNKLDLLDADDDAVEYLTVDDYPFENPDDPDIFFFHDNDMVTDTEEDDYDDDDDFEYFSTDNPLSDSSEILIPAYEDESYIGESQFSDSDQETASLERETNDNRDTTNTDAETNENMSTEDKESEEVSETEDDTS